MSVDLIAQKNFLAVKIELLELDQPLLYQRSYEARREKFVRDFGAIAAMWMPHPQG